MQETAKDNYVHYGKGSKKAKANPDPVVAVAVVSTLENPPNLVEKVGKFHNLMTSVGDVGKGRHQKGHPCKAVKAVCRSCGTKGHYEQVCMKKSTHLVNVPATSTNSQLDYFNGHGDPVYAHTHGSC